jgi:hypothetical protein
MRKEIELEISKMAQKSLRTVALAHRLIPGKIGYKLYYIINPSIIISQNNNNNNNNYYYFTNPIQLINTKILRLKQKI